MSTKLEIPALSRPEPTKRAHVLFTHPFVQMGCSVLASAAAQLFLKRGAEASSAQTEIFAWSALQSGWVWLGILAMVASLVSWLYALRTVPLSVAFNFAGLVQVLVPLGCWILLGEGLPPKRWLGIALVLGGVFLSAKPAAQVEEKI